MENPWDIQSIYEFQYFNCPSCSYKNQSKQEFVNHAYDEHPDSVSYLSSLVDVESFRDIDCPWDIKDPNFPHSALEMSIDDPVKTENSGDEFPYSNLISVKSEPDEAETLNEKSPKKMKCNFCGKGFSQTGHLKQHISSVHEGIRHKCEICGKDFSAQYNLQKHIAIVHEGQKNQFQCEKCDKDFSTTNFLHTHVKKSHEEMVKNIQCHKCSFTTYFQSILGIVYVLFLLTNVRSSFFLFFKKMAISILDFFS